MNCSKIEQETIGLCICLEAAQDMANHALIELKHEKKYPGEAVAYFHSHIHEELFLIRLLDFVKEVGDCHLTGISGSCIEILKFVCNTKSFNFDNSINELNEAVNQLQDWLDYKGKIKLWIPTLDIEANIEVTRLDFLFISANCSKHNLSRLTGVSKKIATESVPQT